MDARPIDLHGNPPGQVAFGGTAKDEHATATLVGQAASEGGKVFDRPTLGRPEGRPGIQANNLAAPFESRRRPDVLGGGFLLRGGEQLHTAGGRRAAGALSKKIVSIKHGTRHQFAAVIAERLQVVGQQR